MAQQGVDKRFENVSLDKLMESVLPFRAPAYIQSLMEKLLGEGICSPSDLLKASKEQLERKLETHANFNFGEMADTLSLRSAMDPDHKFTRRSPSPRRARSRSPQRNHSRASSRPHRVRNDNRGRNGSQGPQGRYNQRDRRQPEPPALWKAVEKGDEALVAELLAQGKDPEERHQGWSPFMKAAEEGQVEILRMLREKHVDMEATNKKGRTALSFAAAPSNNRSMRRPTAVEALKLLLEWGADTTKKCTHLKKTPKEYAQDAKRDDALKVFEDHGF